jgi:hypothetical protein
MAGISDRHWAGRSNPWCVYSRLATALLLIASIGMIRDLELYAAIPIGLCLVFIIVNPFVFPAPKDDSSWATRSVLGQRAWRQSERGWDTPTLYRIASAAAYLIGLLAALEGMLFEGLLLGAVALAFKLGYLDWMAKLYVARKA